jgi:hypothetical protein
MANSRTEITRPIDVRGMMVAGRRVSWATCEIVSRPTNAMIARDEPNANWLNDGRSKRNSCDTSSGFHTRTNPASTMTVCATMAIVPMISLKLVETLIPRTLSQIKTTMPANDSTSHSHARWIGPMVVVKSVMWWPKVIQGRK